MPRPRTKLQVTTFPFLAVLLCAMGSLLLFLFVMDRRAKIAEQNRNHEAMEAIAGKKKDTQAERDARQAEWEQAKEKLRRMLLDQERSVQADAHNVEQGILDADRLLEIAQARFLELQPKLGSEAAKIATMHDQIERERAKIQSADRKEEASKLERTKATLELAELTIAFQELKARRSREKEVYSLVPYRGKQGDPRAPIYVECRHDGVLFHPEKQLLDGVDFNVESMRREVERRGGQLVVDKSTSREKSRTPPEEKKGPYVLFLVRPNGIANYYKAQTALRGYQLDFGYELVDEGWVLEFGGSTAPYQGGSRLAEVKPAPPPRPALLPVPPPPLVPPLAKDGTTSPLVVSGPSGAAAPLLIPPPVPMGDPMGDRNVVSIASPNGSRSPSGIPSGVPPGNVNPGGTIASPPTMVTGFPAPTNLGAGTPSIGLTAPDAPPRESAFVPLSKFAPRSQAELGNEGVANPLGSPKIGRPALIASSTPSQQQPAQPTDGTTNPSPISAPIPGNGTTWQAPSPNANMQSKPATSLEPIVNKGQAQSTYGGSAPNAPNSATGGTPTLSKVIGNKDFVIIIDCFAEHVTIFPGGVQHRWKGANTRETDQAVVQTIVKLIERRQASVREGEPPYRPLIRLQVSPEGLRSYYHVYPLLEHLRVPMTRENVED